MYLEISESSELNFISVNPSCPHTFSSCRMVTIAIWFVAVSILDGPENNHNHNSPAADHKTRHWLLTLHSTIATPIPWPLSPLSSLSSIPSPHLLHPSPHLLHPSHCSYHTLPHCETTLKYGQVWILEAGEVYCDRDARQHEEAIVTEHPEVHGAL